MLKINKTLTILLTPSPSGPTPAPHERVTEAKTCRIEVLLGPHCLANGLMQGEDV